MNPELKALERYQQFLREAVAEGQVWGLQQNGGWVTSWSTHDEQAQVLPFWSDAQLAVACATDEWVGYVPQPIDLGEFAEGWLTGLHNDGMLVGVNWDEELVGQELEPAELLLDLIGQLRAAGQTITLQVYKDLDDLEAQIRQIRAEEQ